MYTMSREYTYGCGRWLRSDLFNALGMGTKVNIILGFLSVSDLSVIKKKRRRVAI